METVTSVHSSISMVVVAGLLDEAQGVASGHEVARWIGSGYQLQDHFAALAGSPIWLPLRASLVLRTGPKVSS